MDQDAFASNALTYDATLRNLELIGEAATHVPDAVRKAHPEIPWRTIVGMRNRVAHGYMGIDNDVIICDTRQPCFTWINERPRP